MRDPGSGIAERRFYAEHPPRAEYRLTDKGRQLGPVLKALLVWGQNHTAAPSEKSGAT
jgi:DNA-binding HxlR family transcriptional regulator